MRYRFLPWLCLVSFLGCSDPPEHGIGNGGSAQAGSDGGGSGAQAGSGGSRQGTSGTGAVSDPFMNAGTGGTSAASGSGGVTGSSGTGGDDPLSFGGCGHLDVRNLDLLFVVDDSGSMKEEQASLRRELPRMIERLTTGDLDGDGDQDQLPIDELHLGVVSSDMGLVGISGIDQCTGLGDDGLLLHEPSPELPECAGMTFPAFLTYRGETDDAAQVASDFACISALGTQGCGMEQQLESALKALWPSSDDRVTFLADPNGFGELGHGDQENAGFLRPSSGDDTSLLAIVLVTDEDDCSAKDTALFRPPAFLDPNDPDDAKLLMQGLNVRCNENPDDLYDAKDRYAQGFKALRPNSEGLVVFAAIVGVPVDLVEPEDLANVDFTDATQRDAFYEELLGDMRMQPVIDTVGTESPDDDHMTASCNTANGLAYPPRRILETAQAFGRDAIVQSICQDDFGPAIDAVLAAITRASNAACIVQ